MDTKDPAKEDLEIELMAHGTAGARDYDLSMDSVEIDMGKSMASVTLMALEDDDIGMEMLMFDAMVAGEKMNGEETMTSMGVLELTIEDATMPMVEAKADAYDAIEMALDDMLHPGDSAEIMGGDLFMHADMVSVAYAATSDSDAVSASASGDTVMIMAEMAGEAHVTVTATAPPMGSSLMVNQTTSNVAQITFPVMVTNPDLMVTLTGPMDMNLVEGMEYEIMAEANIAMDMDTEVMIMRDRSMSDAGDDDYMVDSIMIKAGEMMGSTMLMITDDHLPDAGTNDNMGEMLVLYGMVGDMQTNDLHFTIWDAAVPALPVIAQLLLAAFLAVGGYRRYGRR